MAPTNRQILALVKQLESALRQAKQLLGDEPRRQNTEETQAKIELVRGYPLSGF